MGTNADRLLNVKIGKKWKFFSDPFHHLRKIMRRNQLRVRRKRFERDMAKNSPSGV